MYINHIFVLTAEALLIDKHVVYLKKESFVLLNNHLMAMDVPNKNKNIILKGAGLMPKSATRNFSLTKVVKARRSVLSLSCALLNLTTNGIVG
jgi:hypothetical protein